MIRQDLFYCGLLLIGVLIGSFSQVLLKKAAMRQYSSFLQQYLNPLVFSAYILFFGTTLLSLWAYRVVPLSVGPVLESTSYLYVTAFGVAIFHEDFSRRKFLALVLILVGILVYSLLG